ncbi:caldesmon-like isoform X1 [Schistocerca gregaria]|uniref:caldesmon-like isoform X1 n=1 Tax=Schistocerca gregaria TaxID=7010 RepID=UPI00211F3506|nr:caldesmon-like isoform X1 [Schistocerca gregaria]
MVYESDFYTTRRSYSRPSYSTYSVTYEPAHLYPGYGKGQTYHHIIPYAGHMRLTAVSAPTFSTRTRPSVIMAEIDRINHRMRPSLAYQPAEDFLNSRSIVVAALFADGRRLWPALLLSRCRQDSFRLLQSFDDEARAIRGQAAHLLKRIHTPVPRALRPLPVITTGYEYEELPLPPRITSDMYIQRLLGLRDVQHEVLSRSYYNEPGSRANIGKGHLACVTYAGGKAFSRRRPLASHENNGDYIRNNVKMLSHYERMREAAKSPVVEEKVLPGESRIARGPRPVNSGYYRPTNDPGKEYAEALASAAIATANFNMHTAALEENRKNKQKREDARLASAAEERDKEGESATDGESQSEQVQKKLEEEVKKKAEEEAKRKAEEEAKRKAEEEAKKKAEEEAKKKAEEEAKKKAEEEAKKKAEEEAKKKAEEEAKKKAEEEAKKKAEEEAKRKAEEEAKKKAEEEAKRKAEEEEAKRKAEEEEAKRKAEEEEEEARRKAEEEEARKKAEEEAKKKEEEEARIKAEEEEARRKQEEEEAKKKAEESEPAKEEDIEDIWAGVDEDMPRKKVVPDVVADTAEEEAQPAGDQTESKPAEEEQVDQGPEPVVEEPTSPETPAPSEKPEIEEVPASEEE